MHSDSRSGWIGAYADASWDSNNSAKNLGGYAFWLRMPSRRVIRWGVTPPKVKNSSVAEAAAIFAAVAYARRYMHEVRGMTVKSDCKSIVDAFKAKTSRDPVVHEWITRAYAFAAEYKIDLRFAWVPGHKGDSSTQSYLNRAVDKHAGVARRSRKSGGTIKLLHEDEELPDV